MLNLLIYLYTSVEGEGGIVYVRKKGTVIMILIMVLPRYFLKMYDRQHSSGPICIILMYKTSKEKKNVVC